VLLAPSKRTDFDGRENVGLPVMVGLLRRLYDWLLSLFWYVLTVVLSSFSCCLMSCSSRCRMSPEADSSRHIALLGR
jgi:hypothetical protein